jgi:hypothetical protein
MEYPFRKSNEALITIGQKSKTPIMITNVSQYSIIKHSIMVKLFN